MPRTYERKSLELILSTAESLKRATEQLTQVAADMQQHDMKEALFPWTDRQWTCLDVMITLANQCVAVLPAQITAKMQNRPSQYEIVIAKSNRDGSAKAAKAEESGEPGTAKKRGRPRKNPK